MHIQYKITRCETIFHSESTSDLELGHGSAGLISSGFCVLRKKSSQLQNSENHKTTWSQVVKDARDCSPRAERGVSQGGDAEITHCHSLGTR